jgi:hypothetical protein
MALITSSVLIMGQLLALAPLIPEELGSKGHEALDYAVVMEMGIKDKQKMAKVTRKLLSVALFAGVKRSVLVLSCRSNQCKRPPDKPLAVEFNAV